VTEARKKLLVGGLIFEKYEGRPNTEIKEIKFNNKCQQKNQAMVKVQFLFYVIAKLFNAFSPVASRFPDPV
jgi:hypothetical protein